MLNRYKPHYKAKRIIQDGFLVGFKLYTNNGLTFERYLWCSKIHKIG